MSQAPPGPIAITPIFPPPPTPSAAVARWNLVTFLPDGVSDYHERIFLKLEGPWVRKAGMEPDVNKAVCSWVEFAKLGGNADQRGKIEFWYTNEPGPGQADVTILGERIVAVESSGQGEVPGQGVITHEYRLFFCDFRDQYVQPRGGRLEVGLLNAGVAPLQPDSEEDDPTLQSDAVETPVPELSLRELIGLCLDKMGIASHLPNIVDQTDAPRDLKWFGNHAPSELEKLLGICGCTLVPELNGTATIQQMVNVGSPTIPDGEELPVQRIPKVDRRGKVVIFSSYPTRVTSTTTDHVPDDQGNVAWEFVVQDSKGQWKILNSCDLIINAGFARPGGVKAMVQANFAGVDQKFVGQLRAQIFRCIQAPQDPPAWASPVLNRRYEADGRHYPIQIAASVAVYSGKVWHNTPVPIEISILDRNDKDVLMLDRALIHVAVPTAEPLAAFAGAAPFTVRYSYEQCEELPVEEQGANGRKWFFKYFHAGFIAGGAAGGVGGGVMPMGDGDVENAIDGQTKDAIILTRPSWRLLEIDGAVVNQDSLTAKAQKEASLYLQDASNPDRICAARGFAPIAPSGLVTEVEWDQSALKTTAKLCDWYSPAGNLAERHELRKMERGEGGAGEAPMQAYPNQALTQGSRTALGESGSTQPVLPISPPTPAPISPSWRLVEVSGIFPGGGFYTTLNVSGQSKGAQQMGEDAVAGKDLILPEGMTLANADTKAIGVNLIESGQYTHMLPVGSYQIAFPLGQYSKPADPQHSQNEQHNDVLALTLLQEVDLQIVDVQGSEGGGDGGGEYWGIVIEGRVKAQDVEDDCQLPDLGEKIPAQPRKVAWENMAESGCAPGTHALPVDGTCFVKGRWVGTILDGSPLYRGRATLLVPREKWGVLAYPWNPGDATVTLVPCKGPQDSTPTGEDNVTVYLQYPFNQPASWCGFSAGDIAGYVSTGKDADGAEAMRMVHNPLPRPSQQYQGIFNASSDAAKPHYIADFTRLA